MRQKLGIFHKQNNTVYFTDLFYTSI